MSASLAHGHEVVLALAAVLVIAAAIKDARSFRIPNLLCLALIALFPVYVATSLHPVPWAGHVLVAGLVLAAGFALYLKKYVGAGDIKLLAVLSLWAGPDQLALFLFITTIAGGLLALMTAGLAVYRHRRSGASGSAGVFKAPIPYGVAIAIGGLCFLVMLTHPALST